MAEVSRPPCLTCKTAHRRGKRGEDIMVVYDPGIQMPGTPTIQGHRLSAEFLVKYAIK